jgi:hypothetical protein
VNKRTLDDDDVLPSNAGKHTIKTRELNITKYDSTYIAIKQEKTGNQKKKNERGAALKILSESTLNTLNHLYVKTREKQYSFRLTLVTTANELQNKKREVDVTWESSHTHQKSSVEELIRGKCGKQHSHKLKKRM